MPSQLEQLKAFSNLIIETADVHAINAATASVVISAREIVKLVRQPQQAAFVQAAASEARTRHWSSSHDAKAVAQQLAVSLAKDFLAKLSGNVYLELPVELAFDADGLIDQARELHNLCRDQRLDHARVVVTLPATWQGIVAARQLQRDRINTNLSMVYSFIQAQAGGDAGAFTLSVPVGAASSWYKQNEPADYSDSNDPGVQTATHTFSNLKYLGYSSRIIAMGFEHLPQVHELAGCDFLGLTPEQLQQLSKEQAPLARKLEKPTEVFERPPEMTEKDFNWLLTTNVMAYSQLGSDIRKLANDQWELENFIKQALEEH